MQLNDRFATYLPWVEDEMRAVLAAPHESVARHYGIMQYHLGWVDSEFHPAEHPAGKRLRPLLCLLACEVCGGDPRQAVPAAAALELLHNFSLLHDDIEDNSPVRRHQPAAWVTFGLAQALNAGDGMFSLAFRTLMRLAGRGVSPATTLEVVRTTSDMCIALTEGQFLDMSFETRMDVSLYDYLRMIQGKTAALLGAAAQIGAIVAESGAEVTVALARFGRALGMAFQLRDDVLGIWGAEAVTGKSAASDILSRKKSLPVVYALQHAEVGPELRRLYEGPAFHAGDVPVILELLDRIGARAYTEARVLDATAEAHQALHDAGPGLPVEKQGPLHELLDMLLEREA
jgi:geranylgeranyl diphosphate synthase type I